MKKHILLLLILKDILLVILGVAVAFRMEYGGMNGTILILPMAALLIGFGWIWRGLIENGKN